MNAPQINSQLEPAGPRRRGRGLGLLPPQVQIVNPTVGGTADTTPAPAGYAVQVVLPVNAYGIGFSAVTVSWPDWVDNTNQTLVPGHAQQVNPLLSTPGVIWILLDGQQSLARFTWQDVTWSQGGTNHYGDTQVASVMILPAPGNPMNIATPGVKSGGTPGGSGLLNVKAPVGVYRGGLPGGSGLVPPRSGAPAGGAQSSGTPAPATASSKTPYYVAGGIAVVAAGGAAWWKWGRKGKR